jgi:hypothetical protein
MRMAIPASNRNSVWDGVICYYYMLYVIFYMSLLSPSVNFFWVEVKNW